MTSQETREKWQPIRRAEYSGHLEGCRRCGSAPQIFVVDPAGLWVKHFLPGETFFAARCACGNTGALKVTGTNALGTYTDEPRAITLAAEAWNAEQV